eukprot:gene7026-8168_t
MGTTSLDSILEILQKDPPKYTPPGVQKRDTKDNILLDVLCTVINKLTTNGDKIKNDRREFYPPNRKPPTICIDAYLARLLKYSPCSKECFVMSLVYIDRFLRQCDLIVNSMNIHRLVITSLLISTKYLDDIFYNNEFYSQVGGISLREMNGLEVVFLSMMDYTVNCSLDEFNVYSLEVDRIKRRYEEQQTSSAITALPHSIPTAMPPAAHYHQHAVPACGGKQTASPVAVVPNMQGGEPASMHHTAQANQYNNNSNVQQQQQTNYQHVPQSTNKSYSTGWVA